MSVKRFGHSTIFYPEVSKVVGSDSLKVNTREKAEIDSGLFIRYPLGYPKRSNETNIRDKVLAQPEVYGRMMRIVHDIINHFEVFSEDEGLKKRVEQFVIKSNFMNHLASACFDWLLAGDGYIEPVCVREREVVDRAELAFGSFVKKGFLKSGFDVDSLVKEVVSENRVAGLFEPVKAKWVDQRWIYKEVDKHGNLKRFVQRIRNGDISASWVEGELINFTNHNITNAVYGFTPLSVMFSDLSTLDDLKTFIGNFFVNNGVPDFLINIKNASPNDEQVKSFVRDFKKRRDNLERGSMVLTGDAEISELTKMRDMDFPQLIKYLGYALDLAWGIPPQANSLESTSTRTIDVFMNPYYNRIKFNQEYIEGLLNTYLFGLFGKEVGDVLIKFRNPYLRDSVRNISWVDIAYKSGRLSPSEYREWVGLPAKEPVDIKDSPYYNTVNFSVGNPYSGLPANNEVNGDKSELEEPSEEDDSEKKSFNAGLDLKEGVNYVFK